MKLLTYAVVLAAWAVTVAGTANADPTGIRHSGASRANRRGFADIAVGVRGAAAGVQSELEPEYRAFEAPPE
jgi:hypothetical protein